MTQHEQPQAPTKVTEIIIDHRTFELMQRGSEQEFDKQVGELNFDEASILVGGVSIFFAQKGSGKVTHEGRTTIDSGADGREALEGHVRQTAREMAPHIDDERELVIKVTSNRTFLDAIRRRGPKIERTFSFRNEPPQYT